MVKKIIAGVLGLVLIVTGFAVILKLVNKNKTDTLPTDYYVVSFNTSTGVDRVSSYWSAEGTVVFDSAVKFDGEYGSLKYTFTPKTSEYNYVVLSHPNITDLSTYDYIHFYVYNPTSNEIMLQPVWNDGINLSAKSWTEVKINISEFESGKYVDLWTGEAISATDITNLAFCIWNGEMASGDCIYFSSITYGVNS